MTREWPELRGIPDGKVLEARQLSDGRWLFKISNRKGEGDFVVKMFDPSLGRRLTPSYAHFAIDLYGKLCRDETATQTLLKAIDEIYRGAPAAGVETSLRRVGMLQKLEALPGYSTEYTLHSLEFIFAQEDVNWERDWTSGSLPAIRRSFVKQGYLAEEEAHRGAALAMMLLRRVVTDRMHPVAAMQEVRLRI